MARLIFPIILGLGGIVVLLFLGFWQLDRLGWKEGILADINARMTAGRRILLDQGLIALEAKDAPRSFAALEGTGNLVWPDDVNSSTPAPDLDKNIWFGRDVEAMAAILETLPIMVILNNATGLDARVAPLPVDSAGVKNDHLNYAITWFLLAIVWAIMTLFLITRILRNKD